MSAYNSLDRENMFTKQLQNDCVREVANMMQYADEFSGIDWEVGNGVINVRFSDGKKVRIQIDVSIDRG